MEIADLRAKYPQYADLSDGELVRGLHKAHYADMPYAQFLRSIDFREPQKPVQGAWGSDSAAEAQRLVSEKPWGSGIPAMAEEAGGRVVDALSARGVSPETAAKVGFWGVNLPMQAIPALVGSAVAGTPVVSAMEKGGRVLMQSALKPPLAAQESGDAARAVEHMLKRGFNPTQSGATAMSERATALADKADEVIKGSAATVNKPEIGLGMQALRDRFLKQVNPDAAVDAVQNSWLQFRNHPLLRGKTEIPIQVAQQLKQGTYKALDDAVYGELQGASIESQKQLARLLKEGIAKAEPSVAKINEELGEFVNAAQLAQRRALMSGNRNPLSLAPLADNTAGTVGFLADKSDIVKAMLARLLYSGARPTAQAAGSAAMAAPEHYRRELEAERAALIEAMKRNP